MKYAGKAATSGNSRAFRFDAALFRAHPEFAAGPVTAHVLGPGALLVTTASPPGGAEEEPDPVLASFLAFLEGQMRQRPEHIRPLTAADVQDLDGLLDGVAVDPDEALDDEFELP